MMLSSAATVTHGWKSPKSEVILIHAFGARAKSSSWERYRLQAEAVLTHVGVDEHWHVVADALGRSEWYAKRSRSEREADHERRSVDLYKSDLCRFP